MQSSCDNHCYRQFIAIMEYYINNREDYLVFSLDECSDIEPISEEEEEEPNAPDWTVLVSSVVCGITTLIEHTCWCMSSFLV